MTTGPRLEGSDRSERKRAMSPRSLARVIFVLGFLEGSAHVWGQLRIPDRLVVSTDAAATAAHILANESLFRLGLLLSILAVAFNAARTAFIYVLFRPVGKIIALLVAFFGLMATALQASSLLFELPVLPVLKGGKEFGAFSAGQLQSLALVFLKWNGQASNLYLAFFGFCCMLVGYAIYKSTFLPRALGVLELMAGVGYSTYLWPPLANSLYPYNLALGVGEAALGLWFLVFGVNVERWRERARATRESERQRIMSPPLVVAAVAILALSVTRAGPSSAQPSLLEQGRGATNRGEPDSAIVLLERAVEQSPSDGEAHLQLAIAHGSRAQASGIVGKVRHALKAKHELETAIQLDPHNTEARLLLMQADLAAPGLMGGSDEKALEQAAAIRATDPILGHRAFAIAYAHQKKLDLARKELLDGVREHPDSPRPHGYLGLFFANVTKDYPRAFIELEAALSIDSAYMPAYYHIGRVAVLADSNRARGIQSLRRYLAYAPKSNEPTHAWAHYYLGSLYEDDGKPAEARENYTAAIALDRSLEEAARALRHLRP